jgi:hypothetical protein
MLFSQRPRCACNARHNCCNRPYVACKLMGRVACLGYLGRQEASAQSPRPLPGHQASEPRRPHGAHSALRWSLGHAGPYLLAHRLMKSGYHPRVHSRLDCAGGPRAPSGNSLWDCSGAARSRCDRIFAISCGSSMLAMIFSSPPQRVQLSISSDYGQRYAAIKLFHNVCKKCSMNICLISGAVSLLNPCPVE